MWKPLRPPNRKRQSSVVYNFAFRYGKIRLAFERVLKGELVRYCGGHSSKALDFTGGVFVGRSLDISSGKLGLYKNKDSGSIRHNFLFFVLSSPTQQRCK